ncbi:hypothetical protein BH20ACI4_BH20ACI4_05080 [soil metagenome]
MKMPKFFIFAIVLLFSVNAVFAQTEEKNQIEQSYEVILHVVVASNKQNEKAKLPPALSGVINNLKNDYLYTNYNLAATFLERISINGVVGHTGVLNQLDQTQQNNIYYSDWGLSGLKAGKDEKGKDLIQFQAFNFGAKVPVLTTINAKGDGTQVVNYENIGIRITRFNLPENKPTIIGSLATPKTDEFIFLILTVRPV